MVLVELQTYQSGIETRGRRERGSGTVLPPQVPDIGFEKILRWKTPGQGTGLQPGLQAFPRPQCGTLCPVSWGNISDLWERGCLRAHCITKAEGNKKFPGED